jgi:hypothetical protein
MTKEEWLRNSVDMDRLVVASKIKDTVYLGTVNDFIVNPKLRKHFGDTLGIPVFYKPEMKTKEGYVVIASTGRKGSRLGQHINLTKKANENTFIHELVHVQQGLRGRVGNEVTAKRAGANLLDSYYESMAKRVVKKGKWASEYKEIPPILKPLAKEAYKYKTSDDFEKAFLGDINHGIWFHITDNPKFTVSKEIAPKDYSSMSAGGGGTKGLMVTGDLDAEAVNMKNRNYVAVLDLSEVPPQYIKQVSRGFGNEMFLPVDILDKVKVSRVVKKKSAVAYANRYQDALERNIHSGEDLKKIYNQSVVPVKYASLPIYGASSTKNKVKSRNFPKAGRVK